MHGFQTETITLLNSINNTNRPDNEDLSSWISTPAHPSLITVLTQDASQNHLTAGLVQDRRVTAFGAYILQRDGHANAGTSRPGQHLLTKPWLLPAGLQPKAVVVSTRKARLYQSTLPFF